MVDGVEPSSASVIPVSSLIWACGVALAPADSRARLVEGLRRDGSSRRSWPVVKQVGWRIASEQKGYGTAEPSWCGTVELSASRTHSASSMTWPRQRRGPWTLVQ